MLIKMLLKTIKSLITPPAPTNNYWQNRRLKEFLDSRKGVMINIGSKNRSLGDNVFYADIHPGADLDVVCDIHDLPFKEDSIKGVG